MNFKQGKNKDTKENKCGIFNRTPFFDLSKTFLAFSFKCSAFTAGEEGGGRERSVQTEGWQTSVSTAEIWSHKNKQQHKA